MFMKLQATIAIGLVAIFLFGNVMSFDSYIYQKTLPDRPCDCPDTTYCCNRDYYCGTTEPYCAWDRCIQGPCWPSPPPNGFPINERVTEEFFNSIIARNPPDCPGNGFYTRDAFLEAARNQPLFAQIGTYEDSKYALAAYFALALHPSLSDNFCYIITRNETELNQTNCDEDLEILYPCAPGESYYGRGPLLMRRSHNYGQFSKYLNQTWPEIGVNLLKYPSVLEEVPVFSFESSMWYWVYNVHKHFDNFGHATSAVDPSLCADPDDQIAIANFKKYCSDFGVDAEKKAPLHC